MLRHSEEMSFGVLTPTLQPEALLALRFKAEHIDRLAIEVKPCVEHADSMVGELLVQSRRGR